jgi:ribose 5-phosphate isomerase A
MGSVVSPTEVDRWKTAAAHAAASLVEDDQIVGLGSGSTALCAVSILGQRVREGLRIVGIPTSAQTEGEARRLGIPLSSLAAHDHIDVTIDGADEVDVWNLNLLKGRGGALLREKIIASVTRQLIIVVDETKLVDRLGIQSPVAVEVVPFAWRATTRKLKSLGAGVTRRTTREGQPFITEGGHYIIDCAFGAIENPEPLQQQLDQMVGVVEHGLFLGLASQVIIGGAEGVSVCRAMTESDSGRKRQALP